MSFGGFYQPHSAADAMQYAAQNPDTSFYLSGGTDVLVIAREKPRYDGKTAIDLSGLQELRAITEEAHHLLLGGGCTHAQLAESPLTARYARVLQEACGTVGSPQIRNRGTLAGNLGNASPAADTLGPLSLLNAQVILRSVHGVRTLPVDQFVTGPYRTARQPEELIAAVRVEKLDGEWRQEFEKLGRREALAISRLTVSAAGRRNGDGTLAELRLSLGSAFPHPMRFADVEALAEGRVPSEALFEEIAEALSQKLPQIAGIRASTQYKQPVSRNLTKRLLCRLFEVNGDG